MIKKFDKFLEGCETVGIVGSGTAVSGYPTNVFTKSAGSAVYGGDSSSAFAGNSNNTSIKTLVRKNPLGIFKDVQKKRKKKNKEIRLNNQIGADIDNLHKPNKKINNENMKTWEEFNRLNEDGEGGGASAGSGDCGGGGGTSTATLGNTSGMGAIVSAGPSSIPGDVAGSTKGSGDISRGLLGPYMKGNPKFKNRNKKKKKDKEARLNNQIGAGIDSFYVTKYTEKANHGGKLIQNWSAFTESKLNE